MGEDDNFWPASAPSAGPRRRLRPVQRDLLPPGRAASRSRSGTSSSRSSTASATRRTTCGRCPSKNIDTGMGLERMAAVAAGRRDELSHRHPPAARRSRRRSLRREVRPGQRQRPPPAADRRPRPGLHVRHPRERLPGPNKQKYVIRRLLRRAVLDGYQMGLRDPFLYQARAGRRRDDEARRIPSCSETIERVQKVIKAEEDDVLRHRSTPASAASTSVFDEMRARRPRRSSTARRGRAVHDLRRPARAGREHGRRARTSRSTGTASARRWKSTARRRARSPTIVFTTGPIDALEEGPARHRVPRLRNDGGRRRRSSASSPRTTCCDTLAEVGHDQAGARSCSTARPSMPSPAARSATPASIVGEGFAVSTSPTRRRTAT